LSGGFLIILVVVFGLMWILFIRPQKRRQLAQRQMLQDVEPGAEILTAGGLYGTVRAIDGDELTVEIAPGTNVRLARRAVAGVIPPDEPEEADGHEELAAGSRAGEGPS
jgi:preprotein translocase subunit YajC